MTLQLIWGTAFIVCLCIEMMLINFSALALAIGCLGGLIAATVGLPVVAQEGVAIALAGTSYLTLTPYLRHRFTPRCTPTATDTIIGSQAEVVEAIAPPAQGKVKMDGVIWQARSEQSHEPGAHVTVIGLEGNLLTVVSMDL